MDARHRAVGPSLGPRDVARRLPVGELTWDDLVVEPRAKDELRSLAADAARGGLVLLVHGPAEVGKTFAVQVWAEAMRLDLWGVDCARLAERHGVGVATRGLDEAFAYVERPHAVLLFHGAAVLPGDALDALLARAAGRRAPTVLEVRSPDLSAIAKRLPADLQQVGLPFPDRDLRRRHWALAVARASPLSAPDFDVLADLEVPGAAIDTAVRAVVLARGDERVETDDLLAVARQLPPETR